MSKKIIAAEEVRITVRHEWTGEEKDIAYLAGKPPSPGPIECRWPTYGIVFFDAKSGFGADDNTARWQLTEEARAWLGLPAFGPRRSPRKKPTRKPPPVHPKQLALIGTEKGEP